MRLNIKTKQVLGVTSTVGAVVVALSVYHLGSLTRFSLEESRARGLLLSRAIYQRAQGVAPRASDAYEALRDDAGLKSISRQIQALDKKWTGRFSTHDQALKNHARRIGALEQRDRRAQ